MRQSSAKRIIGLVGISLFGVGQLSAQEEPSPPPSSVSEGQQEGVAFESEAEPRSFEQSSGEGESTPEQAALQESEVEPAEPEPAQFESDLGEPPPVHGLSSAPATAEPTFVPPRIPATPFDQHRVRLSASLGWAGSASDNWIVVGLGAGYFVFKGLEVHADTQLWFVAQPVIFTVTPGVRYVFHQLSDIKPYVGAFYRRYFVDQVNSDTNSVGGRLGLYFAAGSNAYLGGGVVLEKFLDDNFFASTTQVYPEFSFAFSF